MTDHIPPGTKPTLTSKEQVYEDALRWLAESADTKNLTGEFAAYHARRALERARNIPTADETVASPVHQLCLAYEQGFGQGGRLVINPYPPGSDGFEAWEIGRHEWTMRQRGALKADVGQSEHSRTVSAPTSDYTRTEYRLIRALIAHNNAAVELAHARLIRINELEAELAKK